MKYGWPFFNLEVEDVIITISPYHLFPFNTSFTHYRCPNETNRSFLFTGKNELKKYI